MKNIITIMKKEFARFFGDRRMIAMMLVPGVLIYVVYSFMGTAMTSMFHPDEGYTPVVYAVNMPDSIAHIMQSAGMSIANISAGEAVGIKKQIASSEADLCVVFPQDFDKSVAAYDVQSSPGPAPNIEIYFNSMTPNSLNAYSIMVMILDEYESSLSNKFDINRGIEDADGAGSEDISTSIISSMMPLLLLVFLFSGCMALAPESIAGEKERGTLATLLVSPLGRSELAAGKILSLAVLSFLSGLVTAVATMMSLPKLFSGSGEAIVTNIYTVTDYLLLSFVILSTILLIIAVVAIVSAFAKTVKEANMAITPLMILVMLVGVTGMFGSGAQENTAYYLIPMYNSVQSMSGVFSLDYSALNIGIASLSNFVYACIGGFVLTKMFNSEKIMFSR